MTDLKRQMGIALKKYGIENQERETHTICKELRPMFEI
jgi:hypothetical protein